MILNKFPHFKQNNASDCGPTCLRIIAKYYGFNYSYSWLLLKETVGCKCRQCIYSKIKNAPMSGVYQLCHVFQFIIDGFYDRSLSYHELRLLGIFPVHRWKNANGIE